MTNITMLPIENSSNLKAQGYDEASQTLRIHFKNGVVYDYAGVQPDVAQAFQAADSLGKFFHAHIRGNDKYKGTPVQLNEE